MTEVHLVFILVTVLFLVILGIVLSVKETTKLGYLSYSLQKQVNGSISEVYFKNVENLDMILKLRTKYQKLKEGDLVLVVNVAIMPPDNSILLKDSFVGKVKRRVEHKWEVTSLTNIRSNLIINEKMLVKLHEEDLV